MAFTGSSTEESVGLFSTLLDGAIIRNLTLMGANIQSPGSKCGLLAGVAQGEVRIENVEVRGTINMGKDKLSLPELYKSCRKKQATNKATSRSMILNSM